MKPGLFLPRFGPNDAVNAERIEQVHKTVLEQVNGGLSAQHIAGSLRLAPSAFVEGSNLYPMTGSARDQTGTIDFILGVVPSYNSSTNGKLVAVSWMIEGGGSGVVSTRILQIKQGATNIININITPASTSFRVPASLGTSDWWVGFQWLDLAAHVANNTLLRANVGAGAESFQSAWVTAWLSTPHIAEPAGALP
ncbi:MAG TPA: hypothetical protein VIV60_12270 [Polyangiaceae bacterium]